MVGSELADRPEYLLARADEELNVKPRLSRMFRSLAPVYVRLFGVPEIGVQIRIQRAMRELPLTARSFVDVGCGAGMMIGQIIRCHPDADVTGIEIDSPSAQIARQLHPSANVIEGDAVTVSATQQHQFDAAVCIDVLEHIPDDLLAPFARSLSSMLRPGGTAVVHVPCTNQRRHFRRFRTWGHHDHAREGFSADELRRLLVEAGFRDIKTVPTFGFAGSLAWELNMIVAASPVQAVLFPLLLALAYIGDRFPSRRYNGVLAVAVV